MTLKKRLWLMLLMGFVFTITYWFDNPTHHRANIRHRGSMPINDLWKNDTEWKLGLKPWEKEQGRRKERVKNVCGSTPEDHTKEVKKERYRSLVYNSQMLDHLLVDDQHKAIYCYVPKVGCSNWKRMWMILRGSSDATDIEDIDSEDAHIYTWRMELSHWYLTSGTILAKLEDYTKVMIVRNPMERLISAYLNKISHKKEDTKFQEMVLPFVKKQRETATISDIKWPEFISAITGTGGRNNEHWQTYDELCHPCDIDYDVIVKFETIDEDSERFLRLIGAPKDIHFPSQQKIVNRSVFEAYTRNLTKDQINAIYDNFGKDFEMFEYDNPAPLEML